jgi:magnesium chelatase family protein
MLATVPSATVLGAKGHLVQVEVHVGQGLPGNSLVGLPDASCREGVQRVTAAFQSVGLAWPGVTRRVTINLAPPDLRKLGSGLDLAIAVAALVAGEAEPLDAAAGGLAFVGELGLDGRVRPVPGVLPMVAALAAVESVRTVVVATGSYHEARLVAGEERVRAADSLAELALVLSGCGAWPEPPPAPLPALEAPPPDLADVRGQVLARRALEVAAAGGHHLLLVGPPGAGKTMLAQRLAGVLPPLDPLDALEVSAVWSAAGLGLPANGLLSAPPLRAPHHSASMPAIVGGGTAWLRPGEVSCAHRGVLFLDELAEFPTSVLESLRTPLEEGVVRVARARESVELPARFLLVGATNPCPCGEAGRPGACRCGAGARTRYLRRLSGPLLDRFDLRLFVRRPSVEELMGGPTAESTAVVAGRVVSARQRALERAGCLNADLPPSRLDEVAPLSRSADRLLRKELEGNHLTGRGLHRIRRLARTLADIDEQGEVLEADTIAQALQLRIDPYAHARQVAA